MAAIQKLSFLKNTKLVRNISSIRKFSDYILHSDLPDVQIPETSIDEFVLSKTEKWPNHIAAECAVTGSKYTYGEIQTKSLNLSRNFRKKLKFQKGDIVAVLLPNCPEYIIVVLGALRAGLIVTTLNPTYTPREISRQLQDSGAKAIITIHELYSVATASANVTKMFFDILTIKNQQGQPTPNKALDFDEFIQPVDYPDLLPANHHDVAFLLYSSGTTGLPKGAQITHRNFVANICQSGVKELGLIEETTSYHQDVIPGVLPKFHIYGLLTNTLLLHYNGCKNVCLPKFTPDLYVNMLRKYKANVLFTAPPLFLFLSNNSMVTSEDLQSVRAVICGAAPLGNLDEERLLRKAQKDIQILQGYGLTESGLVTMLRPDLKHLPGGSIGRPIPQTSVKIVDPNDSRNTPLGFNQTGELLVKGPQVMKGYQNMPEENEKVFTEDNWFRTGDIGFYNSDKLLFIKDRLKDFIKVKAFQVAPAELEEIIRSFDEVEDVGVIGISHPTQGEVPRAFIVPKSGKTIDKAKLDKFLLDKVAPYKRLQGGIEVIDSIPKTPSGKILRRKLKEYYDQNLKNHVH